MDLRLRLDISEVSVSVGHVAVSPRANHHEEPDADDRQAEGAKLLVVVVVTVAGPLQKMCDVLRHLPTQTDERTSMIETQTNGW